MCLHSVDINNKKEARKYCEQKCRKVKYNGQNWYVGWKCVQKPYDDGSISLYYGSVKINKVAHSTDKYCGYGTNGAILSTNWVYYKAGFHIFRIREGARKYSILKNKVKVLFQNPIVIGEQGGSDVIVATKMIILGEKNG